MVTNKPYMPRSKKKAKYIEIMVILFFILLTLITLLEVK